MRLAIFSDVHGNLEALETVLEEIAKLQVDRIVCLGDVVGYGADPNACVDAVQAQADVVLAGNHDWAAVGLEDPHYFNPMALKAIAWTADVLGDTQEIFLRECALVHDDDQVRYAHASPVSPADWDYIVSPDWGRMALEEASCQISFVGHSHRAFICSDTGREDVLIEGAVNLCTSHRYLINVGSVGQPRDGDARASFVIWDQEKGNLRLYRVSYDVVTAQEKIRVAGLPAFLAERLAVGR